MRMDVIFFFKQKTAYEMRISDWSSDVCSSDLCESEAQANPRSAGEREPSITAALALAALREALRIETFGIPPVLGVAMHRIRAQHSGCPGGDHGIADRTSDAQGTSVPVRVVLGGRRSHTQQNNTPDNND